MSRVYTRLEAALEAEELAPMRKVPNANLLSFHRTLSAKGVKVYPYVDRCVPSLRTFAARVVAEHSDQLTPDMLSCVPWTGVGEVLFKIVLQAGYDTVPVWTRFAESYPRDMQHTMRYNTGLDGWSHPLLLHAIQASNVITSWIVSLNLDHCPVSNENLLELGNIKNLGILQVRDTGIDDRMLSHWTRSASIGKFSRLKLLDLHENDITSKSLYLLRQFPALDVVVVENTLCSTAAEVSTEAWQSISACMSLKIEILVHLGGRGDNRPGRLSVPPVFLKVADIPAPSPSSSAAQVFGKHNTSPEVRINPRKRRKGKIKLCNEMWKGITG